jgi:glucose dehydrogenase
MCAVFRGVLLVLASTCALHAQVTFGRILHADKEPQNWLTYSGSTLSHRYSPLTQVTPSNLANLKAQWAFQARSSEKFEATPLVVDGTMYLTQVA